jgi:hypothetical protein
MKEEMNADWARLGYGSPEGTLVSPQFCFFAMAKLNIWMLNLGF